MTRPTIAYGSHGSFVEEVQACLAVEVDGDFGRRTEAAVIEFQVGQEIESDGVVGNVTWTKLEEVYGLPPYPPPLPVPLDDATIARIKQIAGQSAIAQYDWLDRGQAPLAYTQGMALAFADMVGRYIAADSTAIECAKANTHDPDVDVMSYYAGEFAEKGMSNDEDGLDTLRHLFVLMLGLGMRESSGRHCEGRDMSADNVSSTTAEAGLFQMSWNMESASEEMQKLFDEYHDCPIEPCLMDTFSTGVSCDSQDWACYGSGDGYTFQMMAKSCPIFAVHTAAVGLRNRCQHWGPIIRFEAEIKQEADVMFAAVQEIVVPTFDVSMPEQSARRDDRDEYDDEDEDA